jgi:topoisomerase-4 subunit A
MQYHPHGDQSIGDAMVQIGQKNYWLTVRKLGNILTGDGAAASRYIEARLSNLLWKLFTVKITDGVFLWWTKSRTKQSSGEVSVAFGTRSWRYCRSFDEKLPHNFNELIDSSIKIKGSLLHCIRIFYDARYCWCVELQWWIAWRTYSRVLKIHWQNTWWLLKFRFLQIRRLWLIVFWNEKVKSKSRKLKIIPRLRLRDINSSFQVFLQIKLLIIVCFTACETSVAPLGCVIEDNKPFLLVFLKCWK